MARQPQDGSEHERDDRRAMRRIANVLAAAFLLTRVLVMARPVDASQGSVRPPGVTRDATSPAADREDPARARNAFTKAYPVFMHPRCQNCHPAGDTPLQGDDSHVPDLLRLH